MGGADSEGKEGEGEEKTAKWEWEYSGMVTIMGWKVVTLTVCGPSLRASRG